MITRPTTSPIATFKDTGPSTPSGTGVPPRMMINTCESTTGWAGTSKTQLSSSTAYMLPSRSASIKCTHVDGYSAEARLTHVANLSNFGTLSFYAYRKTITTTGHQVIIVCNDTSFNHTYTTTLNNMPLGWNHFIIPQSAFTVGAGTPDISQVKIIDLKRGGNTSEDYFNDLQRGVTAKPLICITHDDVSDTVVTRAKPILDTYGFKGSIFVVRDWIGTSNRASQAQLDALYAAGWDVMTHTLDHVTLSGQDLATQTSRITDASAWATAAGYTRNGMDKHIAYPGGAYDDNTVAACLASGMTSGVSIGLQSLPSPAVQSQFTTTLNPYRILRIDGSYTGSTTVAGVTGAIDYAAARCGMINLMFHDIVAGSGAEGANQRNETNYDAIMSYIRTGQLAGRWNVATYSENFIRTTL